MFWLTTIVDQIEKNHPSGGVLVQSGGSPSGSYHLGHLRELVTADAVMLELRRRGRDAKHIYFVDDLDALRKVPVNVPQSYERYLGKSLCDIPAPNDSQLSYANFFLNDLTEACKILGIEIEFIYAHEKYRDGFFVPAIERSLERLVVTRDILESVSGRKLGDDWSPIQVNEGGYLKKRTFIDLNTDKQEITYLDKDGKKQITSYAKGQVKLDWRLDWPARWWLMNISAEPFGRDHATKGGSYDTGLELMKKVFEAIAPVPVAYDFINMAGDTKKMSASKGTGLTVTEGAMILPPEVIRYFILRSEPKKRLYFDPIQGVIQLMDEFASLASQSSQTEEEEQLLYICTYGQKQKTVSRVPFSHLVASYQASLKNVDTTLDVIKRTEHASVVNDDAAIIKSELAFIDAWLQTRAPEEVKFDITQNVNDIQKISENQRHFLLALSDSIEKAPMEADGEWFHKAIYELRDSSQLSPQEMFAALYEVLIGKKSGPRAGYFLSILPRDWLISRLRMEK